MVSQGCKNCYAQSLTKRFAGRPSWPAEFKPWTPANAAENVVLHPDRLEAPFSWRTPRRVFVNSMSDLFHEEIPDDFIDQVFAVMALTPQHQYQVLTKRPERMQAYLMTEFVSVRWENAAAEMIHDWPGMLADPLPNVWLGVTVENQRWADHRIPILLDTPAAVRFVSAEPLLGPLDFRRWVTVNGNGRYGRLYDFMAVNWIIVGGESGPKHRFFDPEWARTIVNLCAETKTACFVKQLGGARPGNRLDDLPEDLRVREFPA